MTGKAWNTGALSNLSKNIAISMISKINKISGIIALLAVGGLIIFFFYTRSDLKKIHYQIDKVDSGLVDIENRIHLIRSSLTISARQLDTAMSGLENAGRALKDYDSCAKNNYKMQRDIFNALMKDIDKAQSQIKKEKDNATKLLFLIDAGCQE